MVVELGCFLGTVLGVGELGRLVLEGWNGRKGTIFISGPLKKRFCTSSVTSSSLASWSVSAIVCCKSGVANRDQTRNLERQVVSLKEKAASHRVQSQRSIEVKVD